MAARQLPDEEDAMFFWNVADIKRTMCCIVIFESTTKSFFSGRLLTPPGGFHLTHNRITIPCFGQLADSVLAV